MGELIGKAVEGTLYYAPRGEIERILALPLEPSERTCLFATLSRLNALYMIARAGSGHIGSTFSSLDIVSWLFLDELRRPSEHEPGAPEDIYFSSKGHDAPGLYAVLIGLGLLEFDLIHRLRRLGGLPGHPEVSMPQVPTNTGSLGMGISKAKGMAFANHWQGRSGRIFVMLGDGELQEGQIWESLGSAANAGLDEIVAIVDHNKLQSDTFVAQVNDLGDLEAKFAAFGWAVGRCDGHDPAALTQTLRGLERTSGRPKVLIADTVKGRGVSFMEHTSLASDTAMYRFHSGAPDTDAYARAAQELIDAVNRRLRASGAGGLELETVSRPRAAGGNAPVQHLVGAYSQALVDQARKRPDIVALDADLVLDTGLIPFRDAFPDRFVECGIAEQDMVSQAGGMALKGLLPVVHSFACFLTARANEQIYNNATEGTKIIYVGSLAGVLPGGPGHSHQGVRDISALGAIPGLTLLEPCDEAETALALDYAVNENAGSTYLRLTSIPCHVSFALPDDYRPAPGRGVSLTEGDDAVLFAYGPVMLAEAWRAAEFLRNERRLAVQVINLPWLNRIDTDWLAAAVGKRRAVFTLDNHYLAGGQGQMIATAIAGLELGGSPRVTGFGLTRVPACGTNEEVLRAHRLDARSLADSIAGALGAG